MYNLATVFFILFYKRIHLDLFVFVQKTNLTKKALIVPIGLILFFYYTYMNNLSYSLFSIVEQSVPVDLNGVIRLLYELLIRDPM